MKTDFENRLNHQVKINLCTFIDLGLQDHTQSVIYKIISQFTVLDPIEPGQSILQPEIFTNFAHFRFGIKFQISIKQYF